MTLANICTRVFEINITYMFLKTNCLVNSFVILQSFYGMPAVHHDIIVLSVVFVACESNIGHYYIDLNFVFT